MYNFQSDVSIIKELGLPYVSMKYMTEDTILEDNLLYTVKCVNEKNQYINLDIALTSDEVKLKYLEFSKNLNIKIIYYPYFKTLFNGTIDIMSNLIIINGTEYQYHPFFSVHFPNDNFNITLVVKKFIGTMLVPKTFFPNIPVALFNDLIRYLGHIICKVKGFIEIGKYVSLEWSYGMNIKNDYINYTDKYLMFYDFRVTD